MSANLNPTGDPEADLTQLVTLIENAMEKNPAVWKGPSPWTEVAEFTINLRAGWESVRAWQPRVDKCQELVTAIEAVVENEDWLATMNDPPDDGDADQYRRAVVDILARNADGRS
jgi:hypothetical protein